MAGLGLLVLRLTLAAVFVAHGAHTLFGLFSSPGIGPGGISNTAAVFASAGLHPEYLLAVLSGILHLAGGLLLVIGMFTRWATLFLAVDVAVGLWKVHLPFGFFLNYVHAQGRGDGIEYTLILLGALICLFFTGAGGFSFDGRRATDAAVRAAGRARLRGSV